MNDPVAVLLIIGSAVVGPIEGKRINLPFDHAAERACHKEFTDQGHSLDEYSIHRGTESLTPRIYCNRRGAKYRLETINETCERAMKEIGAIKQRRDSVTIGTHWIPRSGVPVYCIPAPSGLKGP